MSGTGGYVKSELGVSLLSFVDRLFSSYNIISIKNDTTLLKLLTDLRPQFQSFIIFSIHAPLFHTHSLLGTMQLLLSDNVGGCTSFNILHVVSTINGSKDATRFADWLDATPKEALCATLNVKTLIVFFL